MLTTITQDPTSYSPPFPLTMTGHQSAPPASIVTLKPFSARNLPHATNIMANALALQDLEARTVQSQYADRWLWARTECPEKVDNVNAKKVGRA